MGITDKYLNKDPCSDPPEYDLDYYQDLLSQDQYYTQWLDILEAKDDNRTTETPVPKRASSF